MTDDLYGESPFKKFVTNGVPDISFKLLKEYYENDPAVKELMRLATESMIDATWQERLYSEIFRQLMIADNIYDYQKCKDIMMAGLKDE